MRIAVVLLAILGTGTGPANVIFKFAPVIGRPVTQTVVSTTTASNDGKVVESTTTTETMRMLFTRRGKGYVLQQTTTAVAGSETEQLMQGVEIRYHLAADGTLTSITGYEELEKRTKAHLAKQPATPGNAVRGQLYTADMYAYRAAEEWISRIGTFAGKQLRIGKVYEAVSDFAMPTGDVVKFYSTSHVAGLVPCGTTRCARVLFEFNSDRTKLSHLLDAYQAQGAASGVTGGGMQVSGSGERLIDPATMDIYSETSTRILRITVTSPRGTKISGERVDKKEHRYEYGTAKTAP